jgi:dUTP pyrophosphatase
MQAAQKRVSAFDTPEMRFTIIPQGTTTGRITSTEPNTSNTPKSESPSIKVKLADPKAMPLRAHDTDAGADLYCTTTSAIFPGDSMLLDTGVAIQIPVGYVGLVLPRSSHGKIRVSLANTVGVIDSSYRGNIKLLLVNEGVKPYIITAYDTRIAQLVITPIVLAQFTAVDSLEDTERGTGGFGSTNK